MEILQILNPIAAITSSVSMVYLLQEKFLQIPSTSTLACNQTKALRIGVVTTAIASLLSLLYPPTFPVLLMNTGIALTAFTTIKKF